MEANWQKLACWVLVFGACSSHAGFDAFLKIPGVPGEAETKSDKHKDWIEVMSFSNSFRPGTRSTSATTTLELVKPTDKSSPLLFKQCAEGVPLPWARLELVETNSSVMRFFDIRMSNVLVTAASVASNPTSPEARPSESLSLNFTKIEWTYTLVRDSSRLPGELRSSNWNAATGISSGTTNAAVFTVTGIRESSGNVILNWQGLAGRTYDVYACPSVDGPFSFQGQFTAATDGPMTHTAVVRPGAMFFAVEERL
jgi:type VI secretion system secreted protein Hcp